MIATILCGVCDSIYKMKSNCKLVYYLVLTEPIDVYSEWIDECEKINAKDDSI